VNLLFIGDIVGPEATHEAAKRVPQLRQELPVDLVIVNGENCAVTDPMPWQGFGMREALIQSLFDSGVDVITSGNHG
jgi:2',3'-cyclic-nucleotide 2'-phosphodiesterase